jgi:hypothetical protein
MTGLRSLLLVALFQGASAVSMPSSLDFYFTNDRLLEQSNVDAAAEWTRQCVAGGEFREVASSYAPDAGMGIAERQAQAARFDRDAFVRIATEAWQRANDALPQGAMRVCVDLARAGDAFTRDLMGGVGGVTAGSGRIILRIHPAADWQGALPYTLAHELHHSYWLAAHYTPSAPFTLADYLVLEGRADYFANSLFPRAAPWVAPLDPATYATAWKAVSPQLNVTEWSALQSVMFGAPQAGLPMWTGYRLGFRLVSERMGRTPSLDLRTMTAAPAAEFMPAGAGR